MKNRLYELGFALYWLLFAVLAVFAAQSPGFVRHPELAPYPLRGLFIMWVILAALVAAFYFILRPALGGGSSARLSAGLALSVAMVTASFFTMVTDMPGLYYVPHYFSLVTFLVLGVVSAVRVGRRLRRKASGAP
ncbi:hypothetical protein C7S18_06120 [Ahniella affigens]|uniref:Transmembrane protein n=1 Tax=Ahniella affigens TaxID=2021234 RepID=A0A2P1PPN0_9GAMM|nr:hypothetical protein [Ahniella affigens]AVP96801.1 hypothetical protein C7S18_06120 [Ahniella affigens]